MKTIRIKIDRQYILDVLSDQKIKLSPANKQILLKAVENSVYIDVQP